MNHVLKNCQGNDLAIQMPTYTNPEIPINDKIVQEITSFLAGK
jgi:hypothetical protein